MSEAAQTISAPGPQTPTKSPKRATITKPLPNNSSPPSGIVNSNGLFGPFYLEYALMAEYNMLRRQKLPGVYVMPSARSALFWNGVIFIRQGFYQSGVFTFSLFIPDNYPDGDCPRLVFDPPVFHPLVDIETGELDVNRAFMKWRRNVNHIWQVLLYARRVFYKIETKQPINPEAAVLYEKDMSLFKSKVSESIKGCKNSLYLPRTSDDPYIIAFSPWDAAVHEEVRRRMLNPKRHLEESGSNSIKSSTGLSWIKPGTTNIFSKEDT